MTDELTGRVWYCRRYVRCGKTGCRSCASGLGHGPYWYARWRTTTGVKTRYIGKHLPANGPAGRAIDEARGVDAAGGEGSRDASPQAVLPYLRVHVLGQFLVERCAAGAEPRTIDVKRRHAVSLFNLLLLRTSLPCEQIGAALWPEADALTVRRQVNGAAHALRAALEPHRALGAPSRYVKRHGPALTLALDAGDWVDYWEFDRQISAAALSADPRQPLERARALYAGDLMPGETGLWTVAFRERAHRSWQAMLLRLASVYFAHQAYQQCLHAVETLTADDPLLEQAVRLQMRTLAVCERRAESLRAYQRLERALWEELGALPVAQTRRLAEQLRAGGVIHET